MRAWALAVLLMTLTVAPAWAGGWAVTTLDPLPDQLRADTEYRVGYTIRQHGVSPFKGARTSLEVVPADGAALTFEARADGDPGHYVANVRFPAAGTYSWRVNQDWFGVQDLGTVTVLPSAVAAEAPAAAAALDVAFLRIALALAAGGALVLFALKLAAVARRLVPARGAR
jgi:hypothetical protein